ncbi:MAG: NAD(+)/NADH kinase [Bacteroidota bacterium]|nr:NAD(+)/NADH kinase [Bacteroidota bacterium]
MKIGVIGNSIKGSLPDAIETLLKLGSKYNLEFFIHDELSQLLKKKVGNALLQKQYLPSSELVTESDVIIAFGGDGTILSAARMVGKSDVPILGINLGKLGFLAEVSLEEMEAFIQDVISGQHVIEERMMLKTTIEKDKSELYSLNDVVIDNSTSSRLIHISVYVNGEYLVSYSGDGIILATPTGSTAYSLAAGGPIVVPTTQVIEIQPISPHSLSARTVIIPDTSTIRIVVEHLSNEARVTADGQTEKIYTPPLDIYVRKAEYSVKLIKRKDRSYYDVLRTKLLWGSDIRLVKGKSDELD